MAVTIPNLQALLASLNGNKAATSAALTPTSDLGKAAPMQAFQALAPTILGNQAAFARPEAAAWLAQMTGQATPQWAGGPAPAPPKVPGRPNVPAPPPGKPPVTIPPVFGGFGGMFSIPANIQELIAKYRAGIKTPVPSTPARPTAQSTPGPAPSAFAGLRALQGPFGNGGGGLNMQALISAARGRIL